MRQLFPRVNLISPVEMSLLWAKVRKEENLREDRIFADTVWWFIGATGIQITQEVFKQAAQLTVFVRTPNMSIPMHQRRLTPEEQNANRERPRFRLGGDILF